MVVDIFELILRFWSGLIDCFSLISFSFMGITVNYLNVLTALAVIFMFISIFWKGGKM